MKKIQLAGLVFLFAISACNNKPVANTETDKPVTVQVKDSSINDTGLADFTERFTGTINGASLIFEHKDFTTYWLSENGAVSRGVLNTERGYDKDEDATVFVLNDDKPVKEQKYFVRLTDGRIRMLDSARKIVPGVELKRAASF